MSFNFQQVEISGSSRSNLYVNQSPSPIPSNRYVHIVGIQNNTGSNIIVEIGDEEYYTFSSGTYTEYSFDFDEKDDVDSAVQSVLQHYDPSTYSLSSRDEYAVDITKFCWIGAPSDESGCYDDSPSESYRRFAEYNSIEFGYSNSPSPTSDIQLIPIITQVGHSCVQFASPGSSDMATVLDCSSTFQFGPGEVTGLKSGVLSNYSGQSALAIELTNDQKYPIYNVYPDSMEGIIWESYTVQDDRIPTSYMCYRKYANRESFSPDPDIETYNKWSWSQYVSNDGIIRIMNEGYKYLYATPVYQDYSYFNRMQKAAVPSEILNSRGFGWVNLANSFRNNVKVNKRTGLREASTAWADVPILRVRVNDSWKNVKEIKVKSGNTWKNVPSTEEVLPC